MKATTKTAALVAIAVLGTAGAAWAVPSVSDVSMTQLEGTRQVQIAYTLTGEAAVITVAIKTNNIALPDSAVTRLSGEVCKVVQPGSHTILWDAGVDWPENASETAKARVTAWSVDAPPQYCVVDLAGGTSAVTYPVYYYTSADALPYGGLTNEIYKSSYLVMRKIPSGSFNNASGAVTLTKDFYAGVFQVTQGQWAQVMGSTQVAYFTDVNSKLYRPMEKVSYHHIRENTNNTPLTTNWPQTPAVGATSFMGLMRSKTGITGFDLPTEAQWEYACRAGTTTLYNDGLSISSNTEQNPQMDLLGRYKYNGGSVGATYALPAANCGPENGTAIVGSYLPNTWGLYDMHGNVWEWCLDWSATNPSTGTDPKGPTAASDGNKYRMLRGGTWSSAAGSAVSGIRNRLSKANSLLNTAGFRLVRTLP